MLPINETHKVKMKRIEIDGVSYRVIALPEASSYVKTSSVWNAIHTGVRPCKDVKVYMAHLERQRVRHSVSYGKEPFPRNY